MGNHHTADLLNFLADALNQAADDLRDGDERRAAERLRIVHDALRAVEPAQDWETLGLVLESHVARLGPPAEADDSWPYHEHLDDLPDREEDVPSPNLPFSFRKVN